MMGIISLVGCFVRVDSPAFVERAANNESKIAKLRSLQDAWDRIGRLRQFFASASGYLIIASGLLLLWRVPELAKYSWAIPALYAVNLIVLLQVRRQAGELLDHQSVGHAEVLGVIKRHIRICITFSIVFILLATRA